MIANFQAQISNSPLHIFTDFDGTITDTDSLVFLTRELGGGPAVLDSIGQQLRANTMTLRAGITAEMATIRAPFSQAEQLLRAQIKVDPDFQPFVQWCRANQIPLTVLSAGFHEVIDLFLPETEFSNSEARYPAAFALLHSYRLQTIKLIAVGPQRYVLGKLTSM